MSHFNLDTHQHRILELVQKGHSYEEVGLILAHELNRPVPFKPISIQARVLEWRKQQVTATSDG